MKTTRLALAVALLFAASASQASVTLELQVGGILNSSGNPIPLGSIGILVADNNNTGLPTASELVGAILTTGGLIGDSRILDVIQSSDFGSGQRGMADTVAGVTYTGGISAGTKLGLYWFPTISTVGATVTDGTSYGFFRSDTFNTALDGADTAFVMPTDDGFTHTISYLTSNLSGSQSNNTFQAASIATATASPEPSRMMLGAMGLGAFLMRRRRAV